MEQPSTSGVEGKTKKLKRKVFRTARLEYPDFKDWLMRHPDNEKAYCTACDKILACGKSELKKHAVTGPHMENIFHKRQHKMHDPSAASLSVSKKENMDHISKVKSVEIIQ